MPSRATELNSKMKKQYIQKMAELVQRTLKGKIIELRISSGVPKGINFADSIQIKWVNYFTAMVGTELLYALNIEEGRLPGSAVPIEPLIKWCKYKLGLSDKKAIQTAWAIENKIRKEGIKGRHVFRLTVEDIQAGRAT